MQTEYSLYMKNAYDGQLLESSLNQIRHYAKEGVVAEGNAVMRGTDPATQVKACTDITKFLGFAVKDYQDYVNSQVPVLENGSIYKTALADVTAGDPVYLYADGNVGKIATNGRKIGIWQSTTLATFLGVVEIIKTI